MAGSTMSDWSASRSKTAEVENPRSIRSTHVTSRASSVNGSADSDAPGEAVLLGSPGQDRACPAVDQGGVDTELGEHASRGVEGIALAVATEVEHETVVGEPDGAAIRAQDEPIGRADATGPGRLAGQDATDVEGPFGPFVPAQAIDQDREHLEIHADRMPRPPRG